MKDLQYRQKKLLQYLLEFDDFKPVKVFAKLLSCSDKTIRNDLKYLQEQNIEIEKISGKGICIAPSKKGLINELINSTGKSKNTVMALSTEQRRIKILFDLLNSEKARLSIQSLSDIYFVSKTSIVNDLKVIEDKLLKYNLSLQKDVQGTKLIGNETDIRKALVDMLNQIVESKNSPLQQNYSRINTDTLKELANHFGKENVNKVEQIIENIERFLNYKITEPYYINLVTHILILINRIKQARTIYNDLELQCSCHNKKFYEASSQMAKDIENIFNVKLNTAEIIYIYRYLTSSGGIQEDNQDNDNIDDEYIQEIADDIISLCSKVFPIKFSFNCELYRALLLHLRPMINRVRYKIFIKNPILDEVKAEFPELMILLKLLMVKLELKYNLSTISEDEIAYLTVYFQSAIEEDFNKKSVVIVCSSGVGTSHLLERRIKKFFPEWHIVDVVSAKQLETVLSLKDVDLVIATVNLKLDINKPIAYVSALFNKADERRLRESFMKQVPLLDDDIKNFSKVKSESEISTYNILKNSYLVKKLPIESTININIYYNSELTLNGTKIFWTENKIYKTLYVHLQDEAYISVEIIRQIYAWILNNI